MANADRIIDLLHEAKARPAGAEREQFLDEACRDDAALKEQIISLLQAEAAEGVSDFLKSIPTNRQTIQLTEKPGDRIGRYKLLEQIGEGGCGVVYMADQEEPVRRRVALKVIKLGMDTKQVIARFEAERQALAMMDHPNIAKVLDAGATETGRPFFVMELVRGIKITDYCDQNNLSTNERLELFIQVCQAIQHAHQKGIIHRDIKPSNILVTLHDDVAVPKVIDFGIAKATVGQLTDKTVFTAFAQFIGTPAYMSPEQAQMSGLDVDTRADIYSLGVLLYELLTGNTPFDAKELLAVGMDEMRRRIREEEPAKPSTRLSTMQAMDLTTVAKRRHAEPPKLIHLIRGDLDWLVMKCLEKDRTRRYETANGLAADIRRHLSSEPITARPPSRLYEFQKTVRRHKFGFAAAAALILVLGLGVLASTWQAIRATRAEQAQSKLRKEAEAEAAKSQHVAQFMQDMLKGAGPSAAMGSDTKMLREILDKTAERIATDLKNQPEVEAELRNTLGTVYWEIGDYDKSWAMHSQALAIRRGLFGNEHPAVATSLHNLAEALRHQIRLTEAETAFREALAIRRKLFGNDHPAVADSLNYLGSLLSIELKDGEPETLLREALAIRRKLHGNEHGVVGVSLDNLAHVLNRRGQVAEATAMHYEALAIRKKFFGDQHPELVYSYCNLAAALQGQGKLAEAEAMLRDALSLCQKLLGDRHPNLPAVRSTLANLLRQQGKLQEAESLQREPDASSQTLATSLEAAGKHFQQQGKLTEAEANFRESLTIKKKIFGDIDREIATALDSLGHCLEQQRKLGETEAVWREVLAVERKLSGDEHPLVANLQHRLAIVLRESGKLAEAEAMYRDAIALRRKIFGNDHLKVANTLDRLSDLLEQQRKLPETEPIRREVLAIRRKQLGNDNVEVAYSLHVLAWVLQQEGKLPEAEALVREALAVRRKLLGNDHPDVVLSWKLLAELLAAQGKTMELQALMQEQSGAESAATEAAQSQFGYLLWQVGNALLQQGQLKHAERAFEQALQKFKQLQIQFPTNTYYRQEQAFSLRSLSDVRQRTGRLAEAEANLRTALDIYQQLVKETPASTFYPKEVAVTRGRIAEVLAAQGRLDEAEFMCRDTLTAKRKEFGEIHREVDHALVSLARVLQQQRRLPEAEAVWREELALERKLSGDEHLFVATSLSALASVLEDQGKLAEAEVAYREQLTIKRKLSGDDHPEVAAALAQLTVTLLAQQKFTEAEPVARECLAIREKKLPDDWRTFNARSMVGGSLLGQKKYTEAEPLLLSGYEGLQQRAGKIPAPGKANPKRALQRLVQLYELTGRSEKAAEWNGKLSEFDQAEAEKKAAVPKP